jgi:hypothetical protein
MTQLASDPDAATPAMPLGYFEQRSEPWVPMIRFAAWVAIVYASVVIASELALILYFAWQSMGSGSSSAPRFISESTVLMAVPELAIASVLAIGGFLSLCLHRAGRTVVLWSAVAIVVVYAVTFVISAAMYVFGNHFPRSFGLPFLAFQLTSTFFITVFRVFVPVMLWLLFRRCEIREVFERG